MPEASVLPTESAVVSPEAVTIYKPIQTVDPTTVRSKFAEIAKQALDKGVAEESSKNGGEDKSKSPKPEVVKPKPDKADASKEFLAKPADKEQQNLSESPKKEDYPDNVRTEASKSSWDKLKAERDEFKTKAAQLEEAKKNEIAALEKQLLDLKSQFDPEDYKTKKQLADELSTEIRRLRVESHPDFKKRFEQPIIEAISKAKSLVPADKHGLLEAVFRSPDSPERDSEIQQLIESLPQWRQTQLIGLYEKATSTVSARAQALAENQDWIAKYEEEQKLNQQRQKASIETAAAKAFEESLKNLNNPLFQKKEGDNEHNAAVEKRIQSARQLLFGNNTPETLAESAAMAVYGREADVLLRSAHDEIKKLTEQIDKMTGKSAGKTTVTPTDDKPKDWREALNRAMAGTT